MADILSDFSSVDIHDGSVGKDAVEAGNLAATEHIKGMVSAANTNSETGTPPQAPPPPLLTEHPLLPFPTITSTARKAKPLPRQRWSIFRVPDHIREVDRIAYTPRFISIGPFHYKAPALKAVEGRKLRFLNRMLERISHQNEITQEGLKDAMKKLEGNTRECYSEEFENIKSDEFVTMMVLDGCFVVELLRLSGMSYKKELADDPIFATRSLPQNLGRDLLMLENQLPLFVLQKLFELTSSGKEETSLESLALQFFEPLRLGKEAIENLNVEKNMLYPHLLALFHSSFEPTNPHPPPTPIQNSSTSTHTYRTFSGKGWVYSAKSLSHAGVKFGTKPGNVLDMKFNDEDNVLQIPTLFVDDNTSPVLRNLLVYEQYDRWASPYFSSLAVFLNNLVVTLDDMVILKQSGIIRAHCGDAELVNFLYSLTKDLAFDMDDCHFGKIIQDIRGFYQTKTVKFRLFRRRTLKRIYKRIVPILMNITIIYVTTMISVYYNKP
ncbi:putative UPF0481 protein At3g02645 [Cornus florida]|uniref:putative UPF0481 protein At3g02645 n=1 Tax=Cornus florida TaxID=4283 RepID=UPI0028A23CC4|nr:putative UPF0481 protein At3g02645 [Cornus florida]